MQKGLKLFMEQKVLMSATEKKEDIRFHRIN